MTVFHYKSSIGWLEVVETNKGLTSIRFVGKPNKILEPEKDSRTVEQFDRYFEGRRKVFDLPFDIQGTEFQKRVWNEVLKIPFGQTIDYEILAGRLGDTNLTRAVANANSRNPLPVVIPCHRVIGKDGKLTGYLGGLEKKEWLLRHEGYLLQTTLF